MIKIKSARGSRPSIYLWWSFDMTKMRRWEAWKSSYRRMLVAVWKDSFRYEAEWNVDVQMALWKRSVTAAPLRNRRSILVFGNRRKGRAQLQICQINETDAESVSNDNQYVQTFRSHSIKFWGEQRTQTSGSVLQPFCCSCALSRLFIFGRADGAGWQRIQFNLVSILEVMVHIPIWGGGPCASLL